MLVTADQFLVEFRDLEVVQASHVLPIVHGLQMPGGRGHSKGKIYIKTVEWQERIKVHGKKE